MSGVREFFDTPVGKTIGYTLAAVALVVCGVVVMNTFSGSEASALSRERVYVCAESGKAFGYTVKAGDKAPVMSPHSGRETGYEAERCYWTSDGQIKPEPTFVLLNQHKGDSSPTFCPDCGRLVRPMNPIEEGNPPPTAAEFTARRGNSGEE